MITALYKANVVFLSADLLQIVKIKYIIKQKRKERQL